MTTTTAAPTACTDEQKAEWSALHEKIRELDKKHERENEMAAYYLRDHIAAGGMAPGEFGIPAEGALQDYRRACKCAHEAAEAWAERTALYEQVEAHPYTLEVRARLAESGRMGA